MPLPIAAVVGSMLVTGAINTLTKKFQFTACAPTLDHRTGNGCQAGYDSFQKPWSQNFIMFIGEALVIFVFMRQQRRRAARTTGAMSPTAYSPTTTVAQTSSTPAYIFALPCMCDIMATGFGGVGMKYPGITASVWQLMRGSIIVFTSTLSVLFLGKKLYAYNWLGVAVSMFGLILVGGAAIADEAPAGDKPSEAGETMIGVLFVIGAQLFAATQMVVEEKLCKSRGCPPAQIVGTEGMWGLMLMAMLLCIMTLVPGTDAGSFENAEDSLFMLFHPTNLDIFVLVYLMSIGSYNFLGVTVTHRLSAVHRTIIDALRTTLVITVDLFTHAFISERYGAPWKEHTYVQLIGFVVLLGGGVTYHGLLRWPGLYYPPAETKQEAPQTPLQPLIQIEE